MIARALLCVVLVLASHAVDARSLTVTWEDRSGNPCPDRPAENCQEDGFRCERQANGGSFLPAAEVGPDVQTWVDTNVLFDVPYCYRCLAYNAGGESGFSNIACATATAQSPDVIVRLSCAQQETTNMVAPTFIQEAETAWNTINNKTTASFNVLAGDILVAMGVGENWESAFTNITVSDGSLTWVEQQSVRVTNYTTLTLATAVVDTDKTMTVTFTDTAGNVWMGGNVLTFRGASAVGASAKTNVASGAPTLNLTTTQANSAIVVVNGDWNASDGASRTWRTNAGALTEQTYFRDSSHYTLYAGYHADAGAVGTYAVGLSAPTGQKYAIAAVEIKGTVAAGGLVISPRLIQRLIMAGH